MADLIKKQFTPLYIAACLIVFVVVALRAFCIPIAHDEASTFFFYVQNSNYLPYKAHVYTNNHVLNSALANICYLIAGSHRFVLRLPNLMAFIVLCFGVFHFSKQLRSAGAKIILVTLFIFTFNLLDFFELCRGYGLSIAFMVAGLAHLQDYFNGKKFKSLLWFSVFWQLALAANLILVVLLTLLLLLIYFFQFRNKLFLKPSNIILQVINLVCLIFWIKFSFFYKEKGVLDSGMGDDYWEVSFKSLMQLVFGTNYLWLQVLTVALFVLMLLASMAWFFKKPVKLDKVFEARFFYILFLSGLVLAFYLQKKLLHVNYPEDRTGLFFYVFFALSIAVFFDQLNHSIASLAAAPLLVASLVHFVMAFDLKSFTHPFYHVIPKEVFSYLENEHYKTQQLFTVGGHTNREMNYSFANYRGGSMLNPMDEPAQMHMNCDYYFALEVERPYYQFFYDEVAYDHRWHRVLLKRKQPIQRHELRDMTRGSKQFNGNGEYFELLRFKDTTRTARNSSEADVSLTFGKVPKPFKAFLVVQVNDSTGQSKYYKRVLLNWIADDLSGQHRRFKLTTGPLPPNFEVVVYIWNIDKKDVDLTLNELKMLELSAPGINFAIPENYYPYIEKITRQPLL